MKFDFIIGNPPYQGDNHQQLYPDFYVVARECGDNVEMIFPTGWREPKSANNLSKLNKPEIKEDRQIVRIDDVHNAFPGVPGAELTNIVLWKRGHDNGLDGKQRIFDKMGVEHTVRLVCDKLLVEKPAEIVALANLVMARDDFVSMQNQMSVLKPYGLRTDAFAPKDKNGNSVSICEKYGLPELQVEPFDNCITILGIRGSKRYVAGDYPFPKVGAALHAYKVFVPYAWGNMSATSNYLGGAYSDIVLASPEMACTEAYQESGCFSSLDAVRKHARYLMTRFCRALLFRFKASQHSTTAWGAVPVQDYSESWWDASIEDLDEYLFDKYDVPSDVRAFVKTYIQPKSEKNIVNFK